MGLYFERRRSLATGLALAGSGVGTFVFAPLCVALINAMGWKVRDFDWRLGNEKDWEGLLMIWWFHLPLL